MYYRFVLIVECNTIEDKIISKYAIYIQMYNNSKH